MADGAYRFDYAFLPGGWQADVRVTIAGDKITALGGDGPATPIKGAALPGLPNLHSHTFQRGMAGLAERRGPASDSFWTWREVMYRFLGALTPDDVEAIAAMAMVEMLEGGFTSLAEFHYLHHAADGSAYDDPAELAGRIVAAAHATGIGLTLLPVFYAQGGFGGQPSQPGQRRFISHDADIFARLQDAARRHTVAHGMVLGGAPHSLRAVTPDQLQAFIAASTDGPIHIHVAEQMREVDDCLAWSGQRPVRWLLDHAPVDRRWCLIHATHMDAGEVRDMAKSGAVAGLCPITEANLGDGVFAGIDFRDHGGIYGVGSDSNVEIDAAGELRLFEYGQRLLHRGRNLMAGAEGSSTGEALYRSALTGGAQAMGQPVGAIAPGQRADFVVLDTSHPAFGPKAEYWLDSYIFNAGRSAIQTVIAGGAIQVEDGRHKNRDKVAARFRQTLDRVL
jgi:formiminoglutamate deiminase